MQNPSESRHRQRTYRKPELKVLGDLADLTKHTGNNGRLDGSYFGPYFTH